jgi:protein SCO1/2
MKAKSVLSILCVLTLTALLSVVILHRRHATSPGAVAVAGAKVFEVRGQVRSVDSAAKIVRIAHEEIPNYMPAMTMPLPVKDPALLKGVSAGDSVQFQLVVTDTDSWIARIQRIAADSAAASPAPEPAAASLKDREEERLQVGEAVPEFNLVDQDGHAVSLGDFRGKAVLLTFIYTRCPLPNFCPLMSKNFAELEQRLGAEFAGRFHLLSVSMDPEFDRPDVLKDYAARYDARPQDWTFATGDADQIKLVADMLGLYYARENGLISHDLRTALIGPDGRLLRLWKSNLWTPYEVQRAVRETLTGAKDVAAK